MSRFFHLRCRFLTLADDIHFLTVMVKANKSSPTKEALLQEGMQQLALNGYHGTGIKKVLDVVNVPKGSFYHYFDSKEAYVAHIIGEYNQQSLRLFDSVMEQPNTTAIEKLETIYQQLLKQYANANCQKGCLIGSLAAEIGYSLELCQQAMQLSVSNLESRMAKLMTQAQVEGSIRSDLRPQEVAELLWSTWEGVLIKMQMDGNIDTAKRVLNILFKQLLVPMRH